ncbi:hypothetical protein CW354_10320 [Marinicaulis flavus]|uniref:Uncharacterized protein n=2 Tax=Hyphococcus luteus TaxID=2058213 RepID=A0A2S7K845_9PROT|nr:hypothetical protein CW354_10320 [Marinicaulis flavus]
MKIQGFELELEGSREDAAVINEQLGRQLAGMLPPIEGIIEGKVEQVASPGQAHQDVDEKPKRKQSRKRRVASSGEAAEAPKIEYRHDSSKYGNPKQDWNVTKKVLWLLYVLKQEVGRDEFSAGELAGVFNLYFKQFGTIRASNVSRDLGSAKKKSPSPVADDPTKNPVTWYLTDAGNKNAQALVEEALGSDELKL